MAQQDTINQSNMIGENYKDTLAVMVGENNAFYLQQFIKVEAGGLGGITFLGIIWPVWFIYRKMYVEFLATIGTFILLGVFNPYLLQWVSVFTTIIYMLSGRKLYYYSILRKLNENKLTGVKLHQNEAVDQLIEKMGGTSWISVLVYFIIALIVTVSMTYYLMS
ncbi:MAG TPA: hypothetical protein DCY20_00675 [Firmicutes bacterium]|nr:hypothetical protein [Bacillota bacterium]